MTPTSRAPRARTAALFTLLAFALALVSACGAATPPAQPSTGSAQQPAADPAAPSEPAGEKTLTVASPLFIANGWGPPDVTSFQDQRLSYHLYDSLTAIDLNAFAAGEPAEAVPSLASSWEVDESGKVYTFTIREGVTFSTGRPVTAQAVKASFERAKAVIELIGQQARYPVLFKMQSIEAPDERTVVITLDEAFAPFLITLAAPNYAIVDVEEAMAHAEGDDYGQAWLKANSAGTGPYVLEEYIPEQRVVLRRNPNYWGGWDGVQPSVDRIIQLHVPEAATRQLMITQGEVDIVHGLDAAQIAVLANDPNVSIVTNPVAMTINFLADLRAEPLRDVRVRQALRYAIDYEGMKTVVAGGFGEVMQTNILPGMPGHEAEMASYYSFDPERAKALLAEAGYPDGFEITLVSRDGSVGTVAYSKAVTFWQQNLAEIGVKANIVEMTSANMWGQISEGTLNGIGISGAGATVFDPDHPASVRAVQESALLGWDEVDPEAAARAAELTAAGVSELDPARRAEIYAEISRLMVERSPYWTFLQVVEPVVHRADVGGVVFSPSAQPIDLKYVTKP